MEIQQEKLIGNSTGKVDWKFESKSELEIKQEKLIVNSTGKVY